MLAVAESLTLAEFERAYPSGDTSHEFWNGRIVSKGMPSWTHGRLQRIVMFLLSDAGYETGSEVELRISPKSRPKPDVIGTKSEITEPYPTSAADVVVEILSSDDAMPYMIEKCQSYREWGFADIYLLDPESRLLFRWTDSALEISNTLTSVPLAKIWEQFDRQRGSKSISRP